MLMYRNLLYFCSGFHRGMVQSASILAWGASGRPFESGCSDKKGQQFFCRPFIVFTSI